MEFRFDELYQDLREEVREFAKREATPELVESLFASGVWGGGGEGDPPLWKEFRRRVAAKGWLGMTWPREYGGQERTALEEFVVREELARHRLGIPNNSGASMMGPAILLYGSEDLKREFLPRIAMGEITLALGYTEPEAGTDLASLQMRAVRDGDEYVVTGQKVFNTSCHFSDYHWLAVRTDPEARKHRGISLLLVDLKSPGITIHPMPTMPGKRTNLVHYDHVRVPVRNLVGEENQGWYHMRAALNSERLQLAHVVTFKLLLDDLVAYVKEHAGEISRGKREAIRQKLAQLAVEVDVTRILMYRALWLLTQAGGEPPHVETAMLKYYVPELGARLANISLEVTGLHGQLRQESEGVPLDGIVELGIRGCPLILFAAGGREVMKDLIGFRGLGLPRD